MFSQDRICASIGAATAQEAVRQFRTAVGPGLRALAGELRLDYLRGPEERDALFRWLTRQPRLPTIIAQFPLLSDDRDWHTIRAAQTRHQQDDPQRGEER